MIRRINENFAATFQKIPTTVEAGINHTKPSDRFGGLGQHDGMRLEICIEYQEVPSSVSRSLQIP